MNPPANKPGYQTSEFAVTVATIGAIALPIVLQTAHDYLVTLPTTSPWSIIGLAIVALGYNLSRAISKKSHNVAWATVTAAGALAAPTDSSFGADYTTHPSAEEAAQ